jgi:hypothetical protein
MFEDGWEIISISAGVDSNQAKMMEKAFTLHTSISKD